MSTTATESTAIRMSSDRLPGGGTAVCLHGSLDSTTAETVRELLRGIEASDAGDIVVVGGGVESIDRAGVGVLLAMSRRLRLQNRDLFVTMPSATVLRALRLMNLHRVLLTGGRLPMDWCDPCLG